MGSIYLAILVLAVNVIFEPMGTLSVDVPEFQYPCYVDICTFPSQFCNSNKYERRCSPCSREICRAINVPLACRYICMKHNQLITTPKPPPQTTSTLAHQSRSQGNTLASLHLIMAYCAFTTTLLILVVLGFSVYYIHRKRLSKEAITVTERPSTAQYRHATQSVNLDECKSFLHKHSCSQLCRECQRPIPETHNLNIQSIEDEGNGQPPPSYISYYQTRNLVSTPSSSSADSSYSSSKTHRDKPSIETHSTKVNNTVATATPDIDSRNHHKPWPEEKPVHEIAIQTQLLESIMSGPLHSSHETGNSEETNLKSSNP